MYELYIVLKQDVMKTVMKYYLLLAALLSIVMVSDSCKKQVEPDVLREIVITEPANGSLTLEEGQSYYIQYYLLPESAMYTAVVDWESSNPAVATVDNGGRISAYAPGYTTITASSGDVKASFELTVNTIPIESFTVPASMTVVVGAPIPVSLEIKPERASAVSLDWTVDKPDELHIDFVEGSAVLTAEKVGTYKLSVKDKEGKLPAQTMVVTSKEPSEILRLSYKAQRADNLSIGEGETIKSSNFYLPYYPYDFVKVQLTSGGDIDFDKLSVESENPLICNPEIKSISPKLAHIVLRHKMEFGETPIRVKYEDPTFGTIVRTFTYKKVPEKNSNGIVKLRIQYIAPVKPDLVLNIPPIEAVKLGLGEKIGIKSNNSLRAIHCEFSNPDLFNITYYGYGDQYWTNVIELEAKNEKGKSTVTVSDQAGNSFVFEIQVSKQQFPPDLKLKNSSGKKVADGKSYLSHIALSETFSFSDAAYTGDWSHTNSTEFSLEPIDGGKSAKITYIGSTADKYDSIGKSTEVTVYDADHVNYIKFTLAVGLDLSELKLYTEDCRYDNGVCIYVSPSSQPRVIYSFVEKLSERIVPRFDESIRIICYSMPLSNGDMTLTVVSRDERNGVFTLQGSPDLDPSMKHGVNFECYDYFGNRCDGQVRW